jgi:putative ATP-dependent endonuclease of OLD family
MIDHYRSIEHVEIDVPSDKPLVLFGPNNAGKSNIISAINRVLGERYPKNIDMEDSDFFQRDSAAYPKSRIGCWFDSIYYRDRYDNTSDNFIVEYNKDSSQNRLVNANGHQLWISGDDRSQIQSFLVDADREISYQMSYSSKYTLLSKFSRAIHSSLSDPDKKQLESTFQTIRSVFSNTPEFAKFFVEFDNNVRSSVKGFVHGLEVDFSAYDPNNYAKSMRVFAKEGSEIRSFDEFGTGEQQVLLMAFAKAYMQVFGSQSIILILEEPEAHLHPLAQKWLKHYIYETCASGIQVILSTHSADFVDPLDLEGLVKVSKDDHGVTSLVQLKSQDLTNQCIADGVPQARISAIGVADFYATKLMPDSLKGLFASKVLLVEGPTEYFSLPTYFSFEDFFLPVEDIEIVSCGGKGQIPAYYRLFKAYGIDCFCLFDADSSKENNNAIESLLGIKVNGNNAGGIITGTNHAYFEKDFETTMRTQVPDYADLEVQAKSIYKVSGKPAIAKVAAALSGAAPQCIRDLIAALRGPSPSGCTTSIPIGASMSQANQYPIATSEPTNETDWDDDIPF